MPTEFKAVKEFTAPCYGWRIVAVVTAPDLPTVEFEVAAVTTYYVARRIVKALKEGE